MNFEKITSDNVLLFALKHYDNPQCEGEKEFYDDMKRFKYIKRLLKKYKVDGVVKERLLLNMLPEQELKEIDDDKKITEVLGKL